MLIFSLRLLVSCIMLAAKSHDDRFCSSNTNFRLLVGLSKENMRKLERRLLQYLDYNVYVSTEEYDAYKVKLVNHF